LNAEVADECDGAINVIAECLNQLSCLSFENLRLLLIAWIKSKIYEFLRILVHFLSLTFRCFHKI
jgi:hypothetical protein